MTWRDLGDTVALGPSATAERVRRLETAGVITGYQAVINPEAMGKTLQAVIDVRLDANADPDAFEDQLLRTEEVTWAVHVTGPFDYLLLVICGGVADLDRLVRGWKTDFGGETSTRVLLHRVDLDGGRAALAAAG